MAASMNQWRDAARFPVGNSESGCFEGAGPHLEDEGIIAMEIDNLKDMYLAELQELVSVEDQLTEALLRMAAAASHPALKDALVDHHADTARQRERLVGILRKHGVDPTAHVDQAMQGLISETRKMLSIL